MSRVELDSSEVPFCAYVAVVEAATKYRVGSGHLTVAFVRVYIVPRTNTKYQIPNIKQGCSLRAHAPGLKAYGNGTTLLSHLDQSWTEILNANFISIVPSSTRIQ